VRTFVGGLSAVAVLLIVGSTMLVAGPAEAATDPSTGLIYSVSGSDATITGYVGGATLNIPPTITDASGTYTVTAIADDGLAVDGISSLTIPNTVTSIGQYAFIGDNLGSVIIPNSVTVLGDHAFLGSGLTAVTLSDSLTTIPTLAFDANALVSVVIPNSVTTIGDSAFESNDLTSVTIPDTVTTIEESAFSYNDFTSFTFPTGLTTISNNVLQSNLSLTSVTIPDTVTTIQQDAFALDAIASVTIPASVTSMGQGVFLQDPLVSATFEGDAPTTFSPAAQLGSLSYGTGLTVYYYATASGFTTPTWQGYNTQIIYQTPSVTSVSPASGPAAGGTPVTITGTGFLGTSAVDFGTTLATSFTVNSDTSITATVPQGFNTVDVTVTNPGGSSPTVAADLFSYTPAPTVTNVSPAVGPEAGGTVVTITGTDLAHATGVTFDGVAATTFTVVSGTTITATSPAGSGAVDITVTTPGGTSATGTSDEFLYANMAVPTVTSVTPGTGDVKGGTVVTITGSGFTGATAVAFGGTPATSFTVHSDTSITATTPAHTKGSAGVVVTTPGGSSTAASFAFTAAPSIAKVLGLTGTQIPWMALLAALVALALGAGLLVQREFMKRRATPR
jgi:hypothetical protein